MGTNTESEIIILTSRYVNHFPVRYCGGLWAQRVQDEDIRLPAELLATWAWKEHWLLSRPEDKKSTVTMNVYYGRHLGFRESTEKKQRMVNLG